MCMKSIVNFSCDCKKNFGEKCYHKCNGFLITDYYSKLSGEFCIRREWMGYAMLYTDFIDPGKNDETLSDFLERNYKGDFCYLKIAEWIVEKTKQHLYYVADKEVDLINCIMSYLYWSYGRPFDNNNILKIKIDDEYIDSIMNRIIKNRIKRKEKNNIKIYEKKTVKATINRRVTQSHFRKKLINKYGCCQICGMDIRDLLKASHSKPFKDCNVKEAVDIYNGLLLCPNHDGAYDKGYISFYNNGKIILSKYLDEENRQLLNLTDDIKIKLEPQHSKYIEYHRFYIFKGNIKNGITKV